jgi:hypothetical protein
MSADAQESVAFLVSWINSSDYLAIGKRYQRQQKRVHALYDRRLLRVCYGEYNTQWKVVIIGVCRDSRRDIRPGGGGGGWFQR